MSKRARDVTRFARIFRLPVGAYRVAPTRLFVCLISAQNTQKKSDRGYHIGQEERNKKQNFKERKKKENEG